MNAYKTAVTTKTTELIGKGWQPEAATKRARKACKHLHPAHKAATARRIRAADVASTLTGTFHDM